MKNEVKMILILALAAPLMGSWCGEDPPAGSAIAPHRPRDAGGVGGTPEVPPPEEAEPLELDGSVITLSGWLDAHDVDASIEDGGVADAAPGDAGSAPRVFWVSPANGDHVPATATYVMGAEGFRLVPAIRVSGPNEGHLHVLVDRPCAQPGDVLPRGIGDVVDLSEGQDQVRLLLPLGPHTLCLQAGTSDHVALPLTAVLSVVIE